MRQMKDSGIEWIGEIPQTWGTLRLKYCLIANDGGVWGIDPIDESEAKIVLRSTEQTIDGQWCISDPATRNLTGINLLRYRIKPHDLLITKSSGSSLHIGKTTIADSNFKENELYYSNFLQRLRVDDTKLVPRMAWYLLNASFIRAQFVYLQNSTSGLGNINSSNIDELVIPKCPLAEQERIAEFLDEKCAEVDALAGEIKEQIATLEEYKRSVITEAVTKGLDASVPMKNSGIEWIGEIPQAWDLRKGKYVLQYLQKPVRIDDEVITCFRDGQVTLRGNRREDGFTMADKEIGYQGIDEGDLVVHGMDGFAGAIGISDCRGKASPVLNVLDTRQNKRYVMFYLRSLAYRDVFLALSTGIRVRSCDLRWNKLAELFYLIPPLAEQEQIVAKIDEMLAKVDALIAEKQNQLATLEEYKKSVIFEYVTGKKEVV